MKKLVALAAAAVCFAAAASESVEAGSPYLGRHQFGGLFYGFGGHGGHCGHLGRFGVGSALGSVPVPPYFALHPPVYYSHPVPRTYGHSPFPYPGIYETPEIELPSAEIIENPHIEQAPEPESQGASLRTTAKTQVKIQLELLNPHVVPGGQTRLVGLSNSDVK